MTQRRRNRHRKRRVGRRAFLIGLGGSVSAALTYYLLRSIPAGNNAEPVPSPQAAPNPALPSGLLSIYGCGTTDGGAQKFKVSLWKKVDGGAQYVDNTTFYFTADGQNYHCDIDNLDPNASYRVTISYDSSRYYLYGLMKVEGIG